MKDYIEKACSLLYADEDKAPRMTAKGKGKAARRMLKIARENKVPVLKDERQAEELMRLDEGELIPEELYKAVSIVFAALYRVKDRLDKY